jgi:hypothetical protein
MAYSGTFLALGKKHGDDDNQAPREAAGGEGRGEEEHREAECGEEEQRDAPGAADGVQSQA